MLLRVGKCQNDNEDWILRKTIVELKKVNKIKCKEDIKDTREKRGTEWVED